MTMPAVDPNALALEQTHAAWVQAWAGVAQAVGAILAIGASLWIAINADRRAAAAERAAEARAIAAERAAADKADRAEIEAHNKLIDEATDLAMAATALLIQRRDFWLIPKNGLYVGLEQLPELDDIHNALLELPTSASLDAETKRAVATLVRATDWSFKAQANHMPNTHDQWAETFGVWTNEVEAAMQNVTVRRIGARQAMPHR